jgi:hypothetical protein
MAELDGIIVAENLTDSLTLSDWFRFGLPAIISARPQVRC